MTVFVPVDMGGDTLYVADIYVGDNTPGSLSGISMSSQADNGMASARLFNTGGQAALTASSPGANTLLGSATTYFAEVAVPMACTINGIAPFNGTTAAATTFVYLSTASGALLGSGTATMSGASAYQRITFSASVPVAANTYYVGIQNSGTGSYFTHAVGNFGAATITSSAGVYPTTTVMPTTFTASKGVLAAMF